MHPPGILRPAPGAFPPRPPRVIGAERAAKSEAKASPEPGKWSCKRFLKMAKINSYLPAMDFLHEEKPLNLGKTDKIKKAY